MPNVSVVFNAETGQFISNVDGMDKAVAKASERVAMAKNAILQFGQQSVQAAKDAGASSERLASIQEKTAARLASVTEQNASRVVNALDRQAKKAREVAAEMANLNKVVDISTRSGLNDVPNRLKTSTVLRVSEGSTSIRGAEAFISAVPALAALSNFVFPIASAIGFVAIIGEGVEKLKEMYDKAKEVPSALADGFATISRPLTANVLALQQNNDELQNTIDKLEHKPGDALALAIDDARKRTDALADSARTATDAIDKLLKEQNVGLLGALFGKGDTGAISTEVKKRFADITAAQNDDEKQFANADTLARSVKDKDARAAAEKAAQDAHDARQAAIDKQLSSLQDYIRSTRTTINGTAVRPGRVGMYGVPLGGPETVKYSDVYGDQSANNQLLNGAEDVADAMQRQRLNMTTNVQLTGQAKTLQDAKQAAEDAKKAAAQALENVKSKFEGMKDGFGQIAPEVALSFWHGFANSSNDKITDYAKEQAGKYADAFAKGLREHNPLVDAFLKQQKELSGLKLPEKSRSDVFGNTRESSAQLTNAESRARMEAILQDAQKQREQVQIALSQGRLSRSDADKQLGSITANEHAARMTDLQSQLQQFKSTATSWNGFGYGDNKEQQQYVGLMSQLAKEAGQAQVDAMKAAAQQSADSWTGAWKITFQLWVQDATDTAKQVTGLFKQGIDGVNNDLVNLMSGDYKKGDFKRTGHQLFKSGAGDLLQHAEGSVAKAFGFKGKPDGSKSNPLFVSIVGSQGIGGGAPTGIFAGLKLPNVVPTGDGSDGTGEGQQPSGFSKVLGGIFGSIAGMFGGARALGGGVTAGQVYRINENGQEYFRPSVEGSVIPHGSSPSGGGGNVYYSVQVANGVTPEQMNMHVRAALEQYHPQGVKAAVQAVHEHAARRAPSAPR